MVSVLHRSRHDDADLARRVAAGDARAFAELDARHRKPLQRYARTLLRRSEHDAEDVVQDVLIRAHDALRAGRVPDELRPWLYRLVRNRAIDEVRRARWGDEALEAESIGAGDDREEPEAVLRRKENVRRLVADLADLPVRQRTALLARELDDQSPEEVAEQLGVSVAAAQMLATRARENLIKTRQARDADCADVRAAPLDAHERGVRPSEHALRHVKGCDACRAYQKDIRKLSKSLQALNPALGLPLLAGAAKLLGGGGGKVAVAAAVAAVVAVSGGVVVLSSDTAGSGEAAPFELKGVKALVGRSVKTGESVPRGTAVVSARVRVPAGAPPAGASRSVTLACPSGMKVAGFADKEQRFPLTYGLRDDTIFGYSTRGRIVFGRAVLPRDYDVTVGLLCRKPDANGSIAENPRLPQPGEQAGRVCDNSAYLYREPGRMFTATVFKSQPVSILRRDPSGEWALVISDMRNRGWIKISALCG
jgi:RNA polymerase sigma factor (sigma-70 family)